MVEFFNLKQHLLSGHVVFKTNNYDALVYMALAFNAIHILVPDPGPDLSIQAYTTREKPSSSAGFGPLSSAGTGATNKALQLTYSSSACCPTLLLYMNSCSAV